MYSVRVYLNILLNGDFTVFPQFGQPGDGGIYEPVLPPKGGILSLQQKHFKSLSNCSTDSDCLGMCWACGERIVGEGTGCSAMGRPYHIQCFTCRYRAQTPVKPLLSACERPA